ncbi:MAG: L-fucose isomerase [Clostridia bacterium]|nr:L-fucose isomerase [Clostridia bacterium]
MEKRVIGNYPAIGIRPIIDARRGALRVRESLEDKTMGMALAAKKLFEENLRYSDGTPVKVVVADSSIGRVSEAAACAAKFRRECVRITLSVTPCWCYGTETMDAEPDTIKGIWGFNGTERPGAVYLAAVLAAHAQKGLPAFGIYGHEVQDVTDGSIPGDVREKLLRFGRAAVAAAQAEGTSYLQIGSACMGIAGSQITCSFFEDYLGMRVESVDEVEILRRIDKGIYDRELYEKALEWTKKNCPLGFDKNPEFIRSSPGQKEKDLEFSVKCAVIIQDLMSGNPRLPAGCEEERGGHNAIAAGFQGQRQWTDWLPNADFAEAVCNSSFDWNGAREPFVLATENDTLNCASMLLMKLLTNRAQLFADVRTCWSATSVERVTGYRLEGKAAEAGGIIHLINSGAAALDWTLKSKEKGMPAVKPWYDVTDEDIAGMLSATDWCPADNGYFRGGGFSSHFVTEEEVPCTMMRINIVRGLGPVAQIAEGWTVKLPAGVTKTLWDRTDPTWPCTWFAPRCDGVKGSPFATAYDVMNRWGANHGAICYGHIGADLITLCSILRIPVCMHNVPAEDIFRPAVWNAFGSDPEGQDYRACAAYGPRFAK